MIRTGRLSSAADIAPGQPRQRDVHAFRYPRRAGAGPLFPAVQRQPGRTARLLSSPVSGWLARRPRSCAGSMRSWRGSVRRGAGWSTAAARGLAEWAPARTAPRRRCRPNGSGVRRRAVRGQAVRGRRSSGVRGRAACPVRSPRSGRPRSGSPPNRACLPNQGVNAAASGLGWRLGFSPLLRGLRLRCPRLRRGGTRYPGRQRCPSDAASLLPTTARP